MVTVDAKESVLVSVGMKQPGAWWRIEHAEAMLALRIVRINGGWDAYWRTLRRNPAAANDNPRTGSQRRSA